MPSPATPLPDNARPPTDGAAFQFMVLDLLENILRYSDRPSHLGAYLTQHLRELVGARLVVLLQYQALPGAAPVHHVLSVTPERYREWDRLALVEDLAQLTQSMSQAKLWTSEAAPPEAQALLARLDCNAAIALPLGVGQEHAGALLILYLLDMFRTPEILRALDLLSSVVALILRNALLYESQEQLIAARTQELQSANAALQAAIVEAQRLNAELEQRVDARTAELRQTNADLAYAMRAKDEFLANMSHELRTPLTSILGLSESLQMEIYGPLTPRQVKSLQTIYASGEHLLALITDVLDLARIGAGKFELQLDVVPVVDVCEASLRLVGAQANKKRLKITSSFDSTALTLRGDARRLKQMLVNLLGNAVKFTPEGGSVGLEVNADAPRHLLHFVVWDTGIGISPEGQRRLFQPFVQVDGSLTRPYEGAGLGLALVRQLAELHGGSIRVESQEGVGSRFTLSLPWQPGDNAAPPPSPAHPSMRPVASAPFQPASSEVNPIPLILLAEDNEVTANTLADFLRTLTFQVVLAADGMEAIQLALELHPALILMDIQMPKLSGLEAIRQMRAQPDLAATPIVALTALAMPGDRERCLEAGADDYVTKPVDLETLLNVIHHHLASS